MSKLKQDRATKLIDDYFIVHSSETQDTYARLWHRRHRRWVQVDSRLAAAVMGYKHWWKVDMVVAHGDRDGELDVSVATFASKQPEVHADLVEEMNLVHNELIDEKEDVVAVGWVARVTPKAPSSKELMHLLFDIVHHNHPAN